MQVKKTIQLSDLIVWVKNEIIRAETWQAGDQPPLIMVDEVTVEVNFTLSGEVSGGIKMVVEAGGTVNEERVQKATIRFKPVVPPDRFAAELEKKYPEVYAELLENTAQNLVKGPIEPPPTHAK